MREFGTTLWLDGTDEFPTPELLRRAGALVEADFLFHRGLTPDLWQTSYRFVAGGAVKDGERWLHCFGWYAVTP